jgi:hypothetical protein
MAKAVAEGVAGRIAPDGLSYRLPRQEYPSRGGTRFTEFVVELHRVNADGEMSERPSKIRERYLDDARGVPFPHVGRLWTYTGLVGGKTRDSKPSDVLVGKNVGRANETSPLTQAVALAESRYARNMRTRRPGAAAAEPGAGIHEVVPGPGAAGRAAIPPMLLDKNLETPEGLPEFPVYGQPKYDGVRCLVTLLTPDLAAQLAAKAKSAAARASLAEAERRGVVGYSRGFQALEAWPALEEARAFLQAHPTWFLDGELMGYDAAGAPLPLQRISGMARNPRRAWRLGLVLFDVYDEARPALPFEERVGMLDAAGAAFAASALIEVAPTVLLPSAAAARALHRANLADKQEGTVFRLRGSPYEPGWSSYRSRQTIKFKPVHRGEYRCVGFAPGKLGKSVDLVRWTVEIPPHLPSREMPARLTLDPKGFTEAERRATLAELRANRSGSARDYEGRPVTIEYLDLSEDGIPQRAKMVEFRRDLE